MTRRVLALTCSTHEASIAIGDGSKIFSRSHSVPRGHVEFMNAALADLIQEARCSLPEIDLIAVDHGPGSFTGIRVAISIARSLCYLLNKPCLQVESLDILAAAQNPLQPTVMGINAFKNLIFTSMLIPGQSKAESPSKSPSPSPSRSSSSSRSRTTVLSPAQFEEQFFSWRGTLADVTAPVCFVGDAWKVYEPLWSGRMKDAIMRRATAADDPTATDLLKLALQSIPESWTDDWKAIAPLYLRPSAAEENLRKP